VALVCLFVSRIRLRPTQKVMNGFNEIFWNGGVYPRKK